MNLDEKIITKYLIDEYTHFITKYSQDQILGTFVVGNVNYGLADSIDELKLVTVYIPSFEELCTGELEHNE